MPETVFGLRKKQKIHSDDYLSVFDNRESYRPESAFKRIKRYPLSMSVMNREESRHFATNDYGGVYPEVVRLFANDPDVAKPIIESNSEFITPLLEQSKFLGIPRPKNASVTYDIALEKEKLWPYRVLARLESAQARGVDTKKNYDLLKKNGILGSMSVITQFSDERSRAEFILGAISSPTNEALEFLVGSYAKDQIADIFDPHNPYGYLRYDRFCGFPTKDDIQQIEVIFGKEASGFLLQMPLKTRQIINNFTECRLKTTPETRKNIKVVFDKYRDLIPASYDENDPYNDLRQEKVWDNVTYLANLVNEEGFIPEVEIKNYQDKVQVKNKDFLEDTTKTYLMEEEPNFQKEEVFECIGPEMTPDQVIETIIENIYRAQEVYQLGSWEAMLEEASLLAGLEKNAPRKLKVIELIRRLQLSPQLFQNTRYDSLHKERALVHSGIRGSLIDPLGDIKNSMGFEIENIPINKAIQTRDGNTITKSLLKNMSRFKAMGLSFDIHRGLTQIDASSVVEISPPPALDITQTLDLFDALTDIGLTDTYIVDRNTYEVRKQKAETIHMTFGSLAKPDVIKEGKYEQVTNIPHELTMARHLIDMTGFGTVPDYYVMRKIVDQVRQTAIEDPAKAQKMVADFLKDPLKYFLDGCKGLQIDEVSYAFAAVNHPLGEIEDISVRGTQSGSQWRSREDQTIPNPVIDQDRSYYQMRIFDNQHPSTTRELLKSSNIVWSCFDQLALARQKIGMNEPVYIEESMNSLVNANWNDIDDLAAREAEKLVSDDEYQNEHQREYAKTLIKNALKLAYVGQNIENATGISMNTPWEIHNQIFTLDKSKEASEAFMNLDIVVDSEFAYLYTMVLAHANILHQNEIDLKFQNGTKKHLIFCKFGNTYGWHSKKTSNFNSGKTPYVEGLNVETKKVERIDLIRQNGQGISPDEAIEKLNFNGIAIDERLEDEWMSKLDDKDYRTNSLETRFRERLKAVFLVGLSHPDVPNLIAGKDRPITQTLTPTIIGGKQFNSPTDAVHEMIEEVEKELETIENQSEIAMRQEFGEAMRDSDKFPQTFIDRWYTKRAKTNGLSPSLWLGEIQKRLIV